MAQKVDYGHLFRDTDWVLAVGHRISQEEDPRSPSESA